jgi:hypothetical protein
MQNSGVTVPITDCGFTPWAQNRQPVVVDRHRVAVIWLHQVGNADQFRLADVHRRAVHGGKTRGDLHRADRGGCRTCHARFAQIGARPRRLRERCLLISRATYSTM